MPPTSQMPVCQPPVHSCIFNIPTSAPVSNHLQTFDGTKYRHRRYFKYNFNYNFNYKKVIQSHTIHHFGHKLSNPERFAFRTFVERMLLLLLSMALLHLGLIISQKLKPKSGSSFQQSFQNNWTVQPLNMKPKLQPNLRNLLLKVQFPNMFAVLQHYSLKHGLKLTQKC